MGVQEFQLTVNFSVISHLSVKILTISQLQVSFELGLVFSSITFQFIKKAWHSL